MTINRKIACLRSGFDEGVTLPVENRIRLLRNFKTILLRRQPEILKALNEDLNKSAQEAFMTEVGLVLEDLTFIIRHLKRFAKPRRVRVPIAHFPAKARVFHDPYGVALILSPWNYPFLLTMDPLIGAICGGNCALVKPSAYAPATAALTESLIAEAFPPEIVQTVQGGRHENEKLLEQPFDYVFFTGSVSVGRVVMRACADHLTPLTLELGGKSPCIVREDASIPLAARRIAWGKFVNAGQTCVAPDYVLVHRSVERAFIDQLKTEVGLFYGANPLNNPNYPKIISEKHMGRLLGLIRNQTVEMGGGFDSSRRLIEPTILRNVSWEDPVMGEEIFGPILPVIVYDDEEALFHKLRALPTPLALYLFTTSKAAMARVTGGLRYGGGCVNDCLVHLASSYMPFGGAGESGMGGYHGKSSFETFTREKSVLYKGKTDIPLRYPPYSERKLSLIRRVMGG